jgi:hypothetical protein
MQKIPINFAQKGMVLAKEVFQPGSASTMPMCGKGVILTEVLIERIIRLDIQTVCVEGHPVALPGDLSLEEQLINLDRRFQKVNDEPRMIRIREMFKKSFMQSREGGV